MTSKLFEVNYEFKVEYSGGNGAERWVKFFMDDEAVNSMTIDGLIQRINEICDFVPAAIKYMDRENDWVDLRREDSESFSDMVLCAQAVPHRENLYRIMLKVSNAGTAYPVAVRDIQQNPSFLGPTGKRFHSPSPQKPKKRAKAKVKERLEFKNADSENIDSEDFVYVTPTQKYFDKLEQDIAVQQTEMEEKENEIEELEESYGNLTDNSPKCTNCHVSGHNKGNCTFPHCVSAAICGEIKRHPDESKYIKVKKDELKTVTSKLNRLQDELKSKRRMFEASLNTFASQVQSDLINSNKQKYLRKTLTGQYVPNWLAVNADTRKLEKICHGKAPSKSLIPDLIKQFDEGYDVLQDKTDRHSSSAAPKPSVNPVKALWEVKGIRFPESYTIPNEQFLSEKRKFNSQSSATTASKTHLENFGVPKNKSEEDSFLEMGL